MTHFGIFCPGAIGHLNPMCNLGNELLRRGHQVTLFGCPDVRAKIAKSGLAFWEIGAAAFPPGSLDTIYAELGKLSGMAGVKFSIQCFQQEAAMLFADAPAAIQAAGVEVLLVDQVTVAAGTIADYLKLPFMTICNALLINREPGVPPYVTTWAYQDTWVARLKNQAGNALIDYLTQPIWKMIVKQRQQWQLPPHRDREAANSSLAQICQLPQIFDFPRQNLADCFHYTGPFQSPIGVEPVDLTRYDFPFDRLTTDRPLIYAALGTLQNRNEEIFRCIAAACQDLDVQLVISLGNPDRDASTVKFPGNPIVVAYAPQQQIVDRSQLVITHAGMNTVLGTLGRGIPLVAIPITNEQPGIAARLVATGAGKMQPLDTLTAASLKAAIVEVLQNPQYRANAVKIQQAIIEAGGVKTAADIIDSVIVLKSDFNNR